MSQTPHPEHLLRSITAKAKIMQDNKLVVGIDVADLQFQTWTVVASLYWERIVGCKSLLLSNQPCNVLVQARKIGEYGHISEKDARSSAKRESS